MSVTTLKNAKILLIDWLDDRPDLRKVYARWLRATLMRKPEYAIVMPL